MIRQLRPRLGFALGLGLIVAPSPAHAARIPTTYALSAEDQGRAQLGVPGRVRGKFARRPHGRRKLAQAGRYGRREIAAVQRLADGIHDPCALEHVDGAAGEGDGLRIVQRVVAARGDEHEVGKTHRLHGARHRADVAGAARFHQDEA